MDADAHFSILSKRAATLEIPESVYILGTNPRGIAMARVSPFHYGRIG